MVSPHDILNARILIVDDQETNVLLLERMLHGVGYTSVASTQDPRAVCNLHRDNSYDLILLDLKMPGMDGFQVMEDLKEIEIDGYLSVLVITAQPDHKLRALQAGAKDFVSKPFDRVEVLTRIHNMLEVRLMHRKAKSYGKLLEQTVEERTAVLRESEAELRRAQTMNAIGRLAGGVAHDFNNLLTVILGSCELYNRQVGDGSGSRYVTRIQEAATLASKLTEGLLTLSRRRAARPENVNVEAALHAFEPLLRRLAGDGLDLVVELEDAQTWIRVDPGLLDQIVMNLVLNARDAMPGGGAIHVRTARVTGADAGLEPTLEPFVRVEVADSGPGIPAHLIPCIFEPFYTTKPNDQGTGLGLFIVKELVTQAAGSVQVECPPEGGARFRVWLPLAAAPVLAATPVSATMPVSATTSLSALAP